MLYLRPQTRFGRGLLLPPHSTYTHASWILIGDAGSTLVVAFLGLFDLRFAYGIQDYNPVGRLYV